LTTTTKANEQVTYRCEGFRARASKRIYTNKKYELAYSFNIILYFIQNDIFVTSKHKLLEKSSTFKYALKQIKACVTAAASSWSGQWGKMWLNRHRNRYRHRHYV